jgi:hypothetical protein
VAVSSLGAARATCGATGAMCLDDTSVDRFAQFIYPSWHIRVGGYVVAKPAVIMISFWPKKSDASARR